MALRLLRVDSRKKHKLLKQIISKQNTPNIDIHRCQTIALKFAKTHPEKLLKCQFRAAKIILKTKSNNTKFVCHRSCRMHVDLVFGRYTKNLNRYRIL